jgi:hypothetical protein
MPKKLRLLHEGFSVGTRSLICRLCGAHFDPTIAGVCPSKIARVLEFQADEQGFFHLEPHNGDSPT